MVWGLFPNESARGCQKYYIFAKGTYKVGRKDCDVIVQTDTAVSRLHAEIVVDEMVCRDPSQAEMVAAGFASHVRVADRSKFGTWINKEAGGGKAAARLRENQEAALEDGDFLTFGTGNATFRLCYIPIMFYMHGLKRGGRLNASVKNTVSSIGACATSSWNPACTHVLVEQSSRVTVDIIDAVIGKKPVVLNDFLKVFKDKRIDTEFFTCVQYEPMLDLDGTSIKIVDPKSRDKCLNGYAFVLDSSSKYSFGDKIQALLELVGARFLPADDFLSNSQTAANGENNNFVLVIPGEDGNELDQHHQLASLPRTTETKLIAAILSGHLESSIIVPPSIVVSSSHSTDETVVAESDADVDAVTSNYDVSTMGDHDATKSRIKLEEITTTSEREIHAIEDRNVDSAVLQTKYKICGPNDESGHHQMRKVEKDDESKCSDEFKNIDIIFSQDLVVRSITSLMSVKSTPKSVVNFKRFKKREITSGNSFSNLIPFSKDPYKESDYGHEKTTDYMREERKRKQMEAMAEDLFNTEKGKKRATSSSGSIMAFLTPRKL